MSDEIVQYNDKRPEDEGLGLKMLEDIRFVDLDLLEEHGALPRYPVDNLTVPAEDIDRECSLLVYVSHHFDDNGCNDELYALITKGLRTSFNQFASGMNKCYLWLNVGCMDSESNPYFILRDLSSLIEICDCIFTPILGENISSLDYFKNVTSWYEEYEANDWQLYLSRRKSRLEMYFSAYLDLPAESSTLFRKSKFSGLFSFHVDYGSRPHILYGNREKNMDLPPILLPPLTSIDKYPPEEGILTGHDDPEYLAMLTSELKEIVKPHTCSYEGEKDESGEANGHGSIVFSDGSSYDGEWLHGRRVGHGMLRFSSGDFYIGKFYNDLIHGAGVFLYANGSSYQGTYNKGAKSGLGKMTYNNGDSYEGYWLRDHKHGRGVYTTYSGDTLEGEWFEGKLYGEGKAFYCNGDRYTGMWRDSKKHGKGTYTSASGDIYRGNWKNGFMDGQGVYAYSDGSRYTGEMKLGVKDGIGKYESSASNGSYVYDGHWSLGNFNGAGKLILPNGSSYEGGWKDGIKHGRGIYTYSDMMQIKGEWVEGKRISS